jgi:hypothetical protein
MIFACWVNSALKLMIERGSAIICASIPFGQVSAVVLMAEKRSAKFW